MRCPALILFLFVAAQSNAALWYVDNAASGANSGTSWANAWTSFASINWTSIAAGDTLYISGGNTSTTYAEQLTVGKDGTSGNPITISAGIDAGHNGTVIIEGANTRAIGIRCEHNFITINGVRGDYIGGTTTYGLHIQNMLQSGGQDGFGIYNNNGNHDINIYRVEVSGTNSLAADDNSSGVYMGGAGALNITVGFCWIHGPYFGATNNANKWNATGITLFTTASGTGYTINQAFSNRCENGQCDGLRLGPNSSGWNNDIRHYNTSGHSDSMLAQSGSHVKFYNNFVLSSDQAAYVDNLSASTQSDIWYYNNVIYATNCAAVFNLDPESGNLDSLYFLNNTIVGQSAAYVLRGNGRGARSVTNLRINNNLIIAGSGINSLAFSSDNTFQDGIALDYDVFEYASGNVATWTDGSAKTIAGLQALSPAREAHGGYGVPAFVNPAPGTFNFHLASGDTMAIGVGTNLSSLFTTDKDGNTRQSSGPWEVGAYYYAADPAITVQPQNQSVQVGQTATFTITATGGSTLHYQWKFNGSNVGTDSDTYARTNCQLSDNGGTVQVTVSDSAGSMLSTTATLSVTSSGGGGGPGTVTGFNWTGGTFTGGVGTR